jgi:hypothetical protein
MSQMPDKIWLHKDTKYSTADTVCGYQYKFLAENEGIENFVEYVPVGAFIAKACEWLKENKDHPFIGCEDCCLSGFLTDEFIEDFRKEMEE